MKIDLYTADGFVSNMYDDELKAIIASWFNYTTKVHVRKGLEAQLALMKTHKVDFIIVDSSMAKGIPYPEDLNWFDKVLYPETSRLGLKHLIVIRPKNNVARHGDNDWTRVTKYGIKYVEVATMQEAVDYVKSTSKSKISS